MAFPTFFLIWPLAWLLLLVIVPIEVLIAARLLEVGRNKSLVMVTIANLVSTTVSIPVAWLVVWASSLVLKLEWLGPDLVSRIWMHALIIPVTIGPEPDPGADPFWMTLAGFAVLYAFAFLISIPVECFSAQCFVSIDYRPLVWRWAWLANGLSYGCIIVLLLLAAGPGMLSYFAALINGAEIYGSVHLQAATAAPYIATFVYNVAPGGELRVFSEEQVGKVISQLAKQETHQPQVDEVLKYLPDNKCIARASWNGQSGSIFRFVVPKHGTFVIAGTTDAWCRSSLQENAKSYWLYPVKTNGEFFLKVELSEKNTVSANVPGQITLPVPTSTREMELVLQLKLERLEACEHGKRAFRSERFHDAELYARKALALAEQLHLHGDEQIEYDSARDSILLAASLAEQRDARQLDELQKLLTKAYSITCAPCTMSYCSDALAQMYLKVDRRENAMSTYRQLIDNLQHRDLSYIYIDPTSDTPIALEHYADLLIQNKNLAEASKVKVLAAKFRQQFNRMPIEDHRWQSAMAPL